MLRFSPQEYHWATVPRSGVPVKVSAWVWETHGEGAAAARKNPAQAELGRVTLRSGSGIYGGHPPKNTNGPAAAGPLRKTVV
ncbi:MAG: hypothetical protein WCF42_18205 [Terriglobales bacterium]